MLFYFKEIKNDNMKTLFLIKSKNNIMYKLYISAVCIFLCSFSVNAQKDGSKDEVSRYKEEVKQTILNFFEGFHEGDTSKIKKTIDHNIAMQTIAKNKEGKLRTVQTDVKKFLDVIHNRPADQRWDERLLLFKIDTDSGIANAWTPYEFYVNDKFSHCGVNVFQLFNDGNSWKIIAIADTRNKEGCK